MSRPRNKQDLLKAGEDYYAKLIEMADEMSEEEKKRNEWASWDRDTLLFKYQKSPTSAPPLLRASSFGSHFSTNDITNNEHEQAIA